MRFLFIIPVSIFVYSCSQTDNSKGEEGSIRNEIISTFDNYYKDTRKQELRAEFKYLDSSAQFFWIPPCLFE